MRDPRPDTRRSILAPRFGWLVQLSGFVRKEIFEIARQPRLLLVLVVGPFLVLALFAVGFDQQKTVLNTTFVGPPDSVYEESVAEFTDDLGQYINLREYTTDLVAAQRQLDEGDLDLVVVFPTDPAETILSGEQAVIKVIHDKIDPIQQTTVEVSTQVAVQELNARILERVVGATQDVLVPYEESLDRSAALLDELSAAVAAGDAPEAERLTGELETSTGALATIVDLSGELAAKVGASDEAQSELNELSGSTTELSDAIGRLAESGDVAERDIEALSELLGVVRTSGDRVTTLDPSVVVRPFSGDTANLQRESVSVADFFAPAAIALLLQHLVLTFAAMSLVSDRARGLFEMFRVGPIGAGRVLLGKFVPFTLIGGMAGAALITAVWLGLDLPFRGDPVWVVAGLLALLIASIGWGTLISMVSRSDTQAVQYALLALLAGLFFGGFFLDLDAFRYPVKAIAWIMPVTYGTRILRDVMLRGNDPALIDFIGLGATAVAVIGLSWVLLARRLRVE
ncbi:MAG: ABC transporter permease [Ilumatobacter sp.]|nr:ABC transporter permease [Ilumatobacter sp.]